MAKMENEANQAPLGLRVKWDSQAYLDYRETKVKGAMRALLANKVFPAMMDLRETKGHLAFLGYLVKWAQEDFQERGVSQDYQDHRGFQDRKDHLGPRAFQDLPDKQVDLDSRDKQGQWVPPALRAHQDRLDHRALGESLVFLASLEQMAFRGTQETQEFLAAKEMRVHQGSKVQ